MGILIYEVTRRAKTHRKVVYLKTTICVCDRLRLAGEACMRVGRGAEKD